jgi:carbamoyl-phosphate synthase large subunit
MNVLFTNAGRRTYILDYALKLKRLNIFITETNKYTPAAIYNKIKQFYTVQVKKSPKKYLKQIYNLAVKEKIKIIIPLSDHDLEILSKNKSKFLKIGCDIIVSEYNLIKKCINKKLMYEYCVKNKINTPKSYFNLREIAVQFRNLLKKEIKGSGGKNLEILKKKNNIKKINFKKYFIQKKIKGEEFGVDIFFIRKKNFLRICIKKKILMRSGETDRSMIVHDKQILDFCKKINKFFPIYGNLDCDLIRDNKGKIYLIDLNPRFGGGYPATHESGMKFLSCILKKQFNIPHLPAKKIVSKGINIFSKNYNV